MTPTTTTTRTKMTKTRWNTTVPTKKSPFCTFLIKFFYKFFSKTNFSDQDDYSDDDDVSWKIRRAAAKCLESIISMRHELLQMFYTEVSPVLISRFKEREETVKCDIFNVYIAILQQTKPLVHKRAVYSSLEAEEKSVAMLKSQIGPLVKALQKQLKDKSPKTRQGCFSLLTHLVNVLPGALTNHIGIIINGINYSLK